MFAQQSPHDWTDLQYICHLEMLCYKCRCTFADLMLWLYICLSLWNVRCCIRTSPCLLHVSKSLKCAMLHTNISTAFTLILSKSLKCAMLHIIKSTSFTFAHVFEMCGAAHKHLHVYYICRSLWNAQCCTQTYPRLLHLSESLKCVMPHINKSTSFTFAQVFEMCNAAHKHLPVFYICPSLWNVQSRI